MAEIFCTINNFGQQKWPHKKQQNVEENFGYLS
jgi:hypothetical protein